MIRVSSCHLLMLTLFGAFLFGCQTAGTPTKPSEPQESIFHQDSTVYFAKRTASVSMRASFKNTIARGNNLQQPLKIQPLNNGYKFQFRTVRKDNVAIGKVDVIAGGKRIVVSNEKVFLPANQGLTLTLSLADSLFTSEKDDAILAFTFNGNSYLVNIKDHQISEFIPKITQPL